LTPFNGPVSIHVTIPTYPGPYHLKIYNSAGEHIVTLADRRTNSKVDDWWVWNGKNSFGDPVASGVYIIHLTGPTRAELRRILVVR